MFYKEYKLLQKIAAEGTITKKIALILNVDSRLKAMQLVSIIQ